MQRLVRAQNEVFDDVGRCVLFVLSRLWKIFLPTGKSGRRKFLKEMKKRNAEKDKASESLPKRSCMNLINELNQKQSTAYYKNLKKSYRRRDSNPRPLD